MARKPAKITYQDQTHTLNEWSELTGIHPQTLRNRLKDGWKPEEILTPHPGDAITITYKGKTKTAREWAERLNINCSLLCRRIENGWLPEFAFKNLTDEELNKQEIERLREEYLEKERIEWQKMSLAIEKADIRAEKERQEYFARLREEKRTQEITEQQKVEVYSQAFIERYVIRIEMEKDKLAQWYVELQSSKPEEKEKQAYIENQTQSLMAKEKYLELWHEQLNTRITP